MFGFRFFVWKITTAYLQKASWAKTNTTVSTAQTCRHIFIIYIYLLLHELLGIWGRTLLTGQLCISVAFCAATMLQLFSKSIVGLGFIWNFMLLKDNGLIFCRKLVMQNWSLPSVFHFYPIRPIFHLPVIRGKTNETTATNGVIVDLQHG